MSNGRDRLDSDIKAGFSIFSEWFFAKQLERHQTASGNLARSFQLDMIPTGAVSADLELYTDSPYYKERESGGVRTATYDGIFKWWQQKNSIEGGALSDAEIIKRVPKKVSAIMTHGTIDGTMGRTWFDYPVSHNRNIAETAQHGFTKFVDYVEELMADETMNIVARNVLGEIYDRDIDLNIDFEEGY